MSGPPSDRDVESDGDDGFGDRENSDIIVDDAHGDLLPFDQLSPEAKAMSEEDRKIAHAFREGKNKVGCKAYFGIFSVIFPVALHSIIYAADGAHGPGVLVRLIYFGFSLFLGLAITLFVRWTNEDSISGMVAQRSYKISYMVILLIQTLSSFTSGLFIIYAIRSWNEEGDGKKLAVYILGWISPLLSSLILLIPLPVYKTVDELGYHPIAKKKKRGQGLDSNQWFFSLRLYKCSRNLQSKLHGAVVGSGVVTGYIAVILNLTMKSFDYHYGFSIFYMIFSPICAIGFLILPGQDSKLLVTRQQKRMFLEFIGLYYYLSALITILPMNTHLVEKIGN